MHFCTIAMFIFAVYAVSALNKRLLPKLYRGHSEKTHKNDKNDNNTPVNAPDVNKKTPVPAPGFNKNTAENAPGVNKNTAENVLDDDKNVAVNAPDVDVKNKPQTNAPDDEIINPVSQQGNSNWETAAKIGGGIAMAGGDVAAVVGVGEDVLGVACMMGQCSKTDANESDSSNHTASITSPEHNSYDIVNHISNNYYGKESAVDNLATRPTAPAFIFSLVLANLFVKQIL